MKKILTFTLTMMLFALAAQAVNYDLWVAGTRVTSTNSDNITSSYISSGTATYNASSKVLTLTNFTASRSAGIVILNTGIDNLIIKCVGDCSISSIDSAAVKSENKMNWTLQVEGGITNINSTNYDAIYIGDKNISSARVSIRIASGSTLNVNSTAMHAIYLGGSWQGTLSIYGPGTFNASTQATGNTSNHHPECDFFPALRALGGTIGFYENVVARVYSPDYDIYNFLMSSDDAPGELKVNNSTLVLKANNNRDGSLLVSKLTLTVSTIRYPSGAVYNSNQNTIVLNGTPVYDKDIVISNKPLVYINSTNFPDANFRNYLLTIYTKGYLDMSDIRNINSLNLANKGISNMTGIEKFTSLRSLTCYNNPITSLDLSSNTELVYLDCAPCTSLSSLNISNCTNLETLYCFQTNITSLDFDNLNNIQRVSCYNCPNLRILDLAHKPRLTALYCDGNTSMTSLYCDHCPLLTSLNTSGCTSLNYLYCHLCDLRTLNVTGNTALQELGCYENSNLTTITGLSDCRDIHHFDCEDCRISDLSALNSMPNINTVYARNNNLERFNLTSKSNLAFVRLTGNTSLTAANISSNPQLTNLYISGCTSLKELTCHSNDLTTLDITNDAALTTLRCYYNDNLATITGLADGLAITYLDAERCALTDLSACNLMSDLTTLYCNRNQLTSLILNNKEKLSYVSAYSNPNLTNASIYNNPNLETLLIYSCPALTGLTCNNNKLPTLNLTGNTALRGLTCNNNKLSSLNLTGLTNLSSIYCHKNQIIDEGMTTLVNSLPTRPSSSKGILRVLSNTAENNEFTSAHCSTATAKNWNPYRYDGTTWVLISTTVPGDVNGDGTVGISDVTALISMLLQGTAQGNPAADVNGDGQATINDVTNLIQQLINGN